MKLGQQMTVLRRQKGLSQAELGKAIGTSGDIIGRYERDEVKPSIEVAVKIADTLEVSLDYLVGKILQEYDKNTLKRIEEISKLPDETRTQVFMVIDALIRDFKMRQSYS